MNIYFLTGKLVGAGSYVPEDPVSSGGGYYGDKYLSAFITAGTSKAAKGAFTAAYPGVKRVQCRLTGSAEGSSK